MHEDDEISVSEDEKQKELSRDFLKKNLATITEIMDQFVQNDLNFYRSSKARRSVIDAVCLAIDNCFLKETRKVKRL